ncbi:MULTISPECIES: RluA family pseudouridine synthase [Cohnella]|uniref:RluA family pseudouridine synthase n=1 Tax=Cohnella TaxID=329857 RepID=UPI0009BA6BF1|nr:MULTISPECIES: RluA family pseudouridine synthase [Cohnella]MBN2982009.1 RluA family pseudouridine synthase [Cohnella algarum]
MNKGKSAPAKVFAVRTEGDLLPFLLESLSGQGRNSVKSMLARGQISVDGNIEKAYNFRLRPGQTVTVSTARQAEAPRLIGLSVLYEDDDVIVVRKEAGLLSIATGQGEELTAYRQLMEHVRAQHPKNRVFIVHRLDRDTSGVMMFARSEKIQQALQTNWKENVKERVYVALVEGQVKGAEGVVESWLKENKAMRVYSSPKPGDGQHAITRYKVLRSDRSFSLLEVRLETGRKNQIRVHMQDIGHPVVGDKKYGARSRILGRLGLHAKLLAFTHPVSGRTMSFEAPVPSSFLRAFREQP